MIKYIMLNRCFIFLTTALLFLAVIIPNSLPIATASILFLTFIFAVLQIRWKVDLGKLIGLYILGVVITVLYVGVGVNNGAPMESVIQNLFVYSISPLMWIVICSVLMNKISLAIFFRSVNFLAVGCVASVAIFYYLYSKFGPSAVSLFIETANVNLNGGYAAATMHVYGSLIFLTAGFFASPGIVRNKYFRFILLSALGIAAFTSGRSALILSVFIGIGIGFLVRPGRKFFLGKTVKSSGKKYLPIIFGIMLVSWTALVFSSYFDIDLALILSMFSEKLFSGGGDERSGQFVALLQGVVDSNGLGIGHGVGVSYIRNDNFPWRYELIWLATILRVGVLGAVVYTLPFVICLFKFFLIWRRKLATECDIFVFAAFVAVFLASNTNPYIEGFAFQWMYVFPVVYFFRRDQNRMRPSGKISGGLNRFATTSSEMKE